MNMMRPSQKAKTPAVWAPIESIGNATTSNKLGVCCASKQNIQLKEVVFNQTCRLKRCYC